MGNVLDQNSQCNIEESDDSHNIASIFTSKSNYQVLNFYQKKVQSNDSQKSSDKSQLKIMQIKIQAFVEIKQQRPTKFYKIHNKIDSGAFGDVYQASPKSQPKVFRAIKIIREKSAKQAIMNEINILKHLDHPNILKIYQVFSYNKAFYIVTQYLPGGSLTKMINQKVQYSQYNLVCIMKEVMSALNYLHTNQIIHRDIKLQNIIFQTEINSYQKNLPHIKIIDFGVAIQSQGKFVSGVCGTPYFISPETLKGVYNQKCDIWSCGVILYLLFSGTMPFQGRTIDEIYSKIQTCQPSFLGKQWENISECGKNLVKCMLNKDWKQRISAKEVLESQWMKYKKLQVLSYQQTALKQLQNHYFQDNFSAMIWTYLASMTSNIEDRRKIGEIFQSIDQDKSGFIDKNQLIQAYSKQNCFFDDCEIDNILSRIDTNRSGKIDFTQFLTALAKRQKMFVKQKLIQAFQYFDLDKTGFIEVDEIKKLLKVNNAIIIDQILFKFDKNKDSRISQEQFINQLINNQNQNLIVLQQAMNNSFINKIKTGPKTSPKLKKQMKRYSHR